MAEKNILLTGVFGPYAQNDEYGSRTINPMELYHNQVTRVQGPFSLRMFHRTFGLMMIEANIDAPCTVLDFPTLDRFMDEIKENNYDVIGISAIVPNFLKVKKMCQEIRDHLPNATIVIGGHIANYEDLDDTIDADHICKGDGIRWFRKFLGQDVDAPIKHPALISGFGIRIMGFPVWGRNTAGTLIPSVGCPMGCNFCSTSALFGGKGNSVTFYETGDELFSVLCQLEKKLKVNSFFIQDENFLLYKKRALRLLELMEQHNKSWAFYIFSSAKVLESYTIEQLIKLGISWVWLGLEGEKSQYSKLQGVDLKNLVKTFQSNGIRVLGSTIIGLEEHTPENIDSVIDYAAQFNTDFHQFMLYTPLPGTPLYKEHKDKNEILSEEDCSAADAHGQDRFNFHHKHINNNREHEYLIHAFERDFQVNGPSLARIARTTLTGWIKYKNHPDKRIARRFKNENSGLNSVYAGSIWAMAKWYRDDRIMHEKLITILDDLYSEYGLKTRILATVIGHFIFPFIVREAKRLSQGWTYEPPTVYEKNEKALQLEKKIFGLFNIKKPKISFPAYDLTHVLNNCTLQMEEIQEQMIEYKEKAREQLNSIREQMTEKKEHATEQITQIREQLTELSDATQNQLNIVQDTMSKRYRKSRKHIKEIRKNMTINCRLVQEQIEESCRHLEEKIEAKIFPANTKV